MGGRKKSNGSVRSIFMHADAADLWLMAFGFLGALGDGFSMPVVLYVTSEIMNNIGSSSTSAADAFVDKINKVLCFSLSLSLSRFMYTQGCMYN